MIFFVRILNLALFYFLFIFYYLKIMVIKKVCIIGGGIGGLVALRNILTTNCDENDEIKLEPILYEKSDQIGGVWVFREDENTNAMYSELRSNMPKETSFFFDFGCDQYDSEDSYIHHSGVLNYLKKYAEHFKLQPYINLNCEVKSVEAFEPENGQTKWKVTIENDKNEIAHNIFDSVIICNGHHNKPKYPETLYQDTLDKFQGKILHTFNYKRPEDFKNSNVVIVGGGNSGIDIGLQISKCANQVYLSLKELCMRKYGGVDSIQNFRQVKEIKKVNPSSIILLNDEEIFCDTIIFATGYEYEFPFLNSDLISISQEGRTVSPLYRHMIHRKFPSLAFIGLPSIATFFILNDCQARFYTRYLLGHIQLPTDFEIESENQSELQERQSLQLDSNKPHLFHTFQWSYYRKLASEGGFSQEIEKNLPQIEQIYNYVLDRIVNDPLNYREENFKDLSKLKHTCCKNGRKTFC